MSTNHSYTTSSSNHKHFFSWQVGFPRRLNESAAWASLASTPLRLTVKVDSLHCHSWTLSNPNWEDRHRLIRYLEWLSQNVCTAKETNRLSFVSFPFVNLSLKMLDSVLVWAVWRAWIQWTGHSGGKTIPCEVPGLFVKENSLIKVDGPHSSVTIKRKKKRKPPIVGFKGPIVVLLPRTVLRRPGAQLGLLTARYSNKSW